VRENRKFAHFRDLPTECAFVSGATTRKSKNLAQNAHCIITVESLGLDLIVEGEATKVRDEARREQIADASAVQGWHPIVRHGVF
jgi:hypothetical protein